MISYFITQYYVANPTMEIKSPIGNKGAYMTVKLRVFMKDAYY